MLLTTPWNTPSFLCLAQWIFFLKIDDYKINVIYRKNMENIKHESKQLSLKKRKLLKLELEKKKSSKSRSCEKVRWSQVETPQPVQTRWPGVQKLDKRDFPWPPKAEGSVFRKE